MAELNHLDTMGKGQDQTMTVLSIEKHGDNDSAQLARLGKSQVLRVCLFFVYPFPRKAQKNKKVITGAALLTNGFYVLARLWLRCYVGV